MGVFLEVARSLELYHAFVRLFLKPALGASDMLLLLPAPCASDELFLASSSERAEHRCSLTVLSLFVRPRSFC